MWPTWLWAMSPRVAHFLKMVVHTWFKQSQDELVSILNTFWFRFLVETQDCAVLNNKQEKFIYNQDLAIK